MFLHIYNTYTTDISIYYSHIYIYIYVEISLPQCHAHTHTQMCIYSTYIIYDYIYIIYMYLDQSYVCVCVRIMYMSCRKHTRNSKPLSRMQSRICCLVALANLQLLEGDQDWFCLNWDEWDVRKSMRDCRWLV